MLTVFICMIVCGICGWKRTCAVLFYCLFMEGLEYMLDLLIPLLSFIYTSVIQYATLRVSLVEQELHTFPEHLISPPVLVGSCRSLFRFPCSVLLIVVCPFSLAIVLSVLLWFIDSDYPFCVFHLFLFNIPMRIITSFKRFLNFKVKI